MNKNEDFAIVIDKNNPWLYRTFLQFFFSVACFWDCLASEAIVVIYISKGVIGGDIENIGISS